MAAKITKLSPEQERQLETHRATWLSIGTRTGHDAECEVTGTAAINAAYKAIGVEPPKFVLWAQSPRQALFMHWVVRGLLDHDSTWAASTLGERDQLGSQLLSQIGGQLSARRPKCRSFWSRREMNAVSRSTVSTPMARP
jgi:hypothetical protein